MTSDARPAGWYDDPQIAGTQRWWNGVTATDHVRLTPGSGADPGTDGWPPIAPPPLQAPAIGPAGPAPGWYPDPAGTGQPRWWDGTSWAASSPAAFGPGYPVHTTVVTVAPPKSVGVAFLLTFLFGPLGMLYSTVTGALVMIIVSLFGGFVVGILTFGLAWFAWWPFIWLVSIIWGCVAASEKSGTQVITHARY